MPSRRKPPPDPSHSGGQSEPPAPHDKLQELINGLPEEKKLELVKALQVASSAETTFSGPLPRPEDFEKYNQIEPGAADRILSMAEKEQQIRADGQAGMLANDRRRITGAAWIGVLLVGVAGLATWMGNEVIALSLGSPERSSRLSAESWTGWSVAGMPMDLNKQASVRRRAA